MYIWWIISLIILIACSIFAYRMIVTSYEFLPADKKFFSGLSKNTIFGQRSFTPQVEPRIVTGNAPRVQDNAAFYEIQISKIQQRLKALEDQYSLKSLQEISGLQVAKDKDEEEDWKELYYEENSLKEKLENELDFARQELEEAKSESSQSGEILNAWKELQSDYELKVVDLQSLQNNIDLLNRQLQASAEREEELEDLLLSEITMREKYSLLQTNYAQLLSQADVMQRRNIEVDKKEADYHMVVRRQRQLESHLAICKDENFRLKTDLEKYINQNKNFNPEYEKS